MTYQTVKDIRAKAIRHIQVLPLSYLDGHSTGDIISRIIADTDILSDGMLLGFTQSFFRNRNDHRNTDLHVLQKLLDYIDGHCPDPHKLFGGQIYFFPYLPDVPEAKRCQRTSDCSHRRDDWKPEGCSGFLDMRKKSSERFAKVNEELQECSLKAVFYSSLTNPSTRFVNNIIYACVALVGAFIIPGGRLTVGGLSVLLSYANQYMKPFNDISSVVTELQNALACAGRIFDLLEEEPEVAEASETLKDVKGEVDIKNVCFHYDESKKLIEDFNLHVKPGMRVAIVGPTGCGKSTFINLLMRFYDVNSGSISVDGKQIRDITRHSLRSSYGMVLQETWIKNGTVRDNISIGKPEATDTEIIEAAKLTHSWEFIRRLPKGLDTMLNEDSLSQGQKQLLCITRVMLCLPPMLILDEATSSIDTRTELQIQEAFERMMEGRTSFIVAHRLSTIRNADLILVMKDGSIIEQGTHDELIAKGGFYHTLYNSQFAKVSE